MATINVFIGGASDGETSTSLTFPLPTQFLVACVDYDGLVLAGNDTTGAIGVGTTLATALASAVLTPFKTYERLGQILPRFGNDATLYVLGKGRTASATYLKMDAVTNQDAGWRNQISGYRLVSMRSTLDFTDNANDRIQAGWQIVPGTNVGGYNTTGGTNITLPCQLAGGGAAGLPVEAGGVSTITGYRIRFDANTQTVALRNICRVIYSNTAAQILAESALPAVPVAGNAGDIFYIEQTTLQFGSGSCHYGDCDNVRISSERWTAATTLTFNMGAVTMSGCDTTASLQVGRGQVVNFQGNSFFADGTFANIGGGGRHSSVAAFSMFDIRQLTIVQTTLFGFLQLNWIDHHNVGTACTFAQGGTDSGFAGTSGQFAQSAQQPNRIWGSNSTANFQRLRIAAPNAQGAGLVMSSQSGIIRGVDISGQTGPAINFGTIGNFNIRQAWMVDDVVSTAGGNIDVVLQMSGQDAIIRYGLVVANTIAATIADARLQGAILATFAGLANTNYWDPQGNNLIGAAGEVMDKPGKGFVNSSGGAIAALSPVRSNGVTGQMTTAQANTGANAAGLIGVCVTAPANAANGLVATPGTVSAVQFDASAAVVAGGIAYLSTGTAGNAQALIPALAATNQKNRLGVVGSFAGTIGVLTFNPDKLAVLADGLA